MTGLTAFIVAMLRAPIASLTRADPAKLGAKYGIPAPTASGYLNMHLGRK